MAAAWPGLAGCSAEVILEVILAGESFATPALVRLSRRVNPLGCQVSPEVFEFGEAVASCLSAEEWLDCVSR